MFNKNSQRHYFLSLPLCPKSIAQAMISLSNLKKKKKEKKRSHNSAFASEPIIPSSAYFTHACCPRFMKKPLG